MMDDPNVERGELRGALRYIERINRWLGGRSALLTHLERWSVRWPKDRPITLLDIATGSADLPIAAVRWARKAGFDLRVTAIDVHEGTLEVARERVNAAGLADVIELRRLAAQRLSDEYRFDSFDYVHAGLFLHHLPELEILTVLRIMDRLGRRGLVWNDLVRSPAGATVIKLATVGQSRMIRHDAYVSVLAGFTRDEALDLARRVDIGYVEYRWNVWTHRFTLAGEKPTVV